MEIDKRSKSVTSNRSILFHNSFLSISFEVKPLKLWRPGNIANFYDILPRRRPSDDDTPSQNDSSRVLKLDGFVVFTPEPHRSVFPRRLLTFPTYALNELERVINPRHFYVCYDILGILVVTRFIKFCFLPYKTGTPGEKTPPLKLNLHV